MPAINQKKTDKETAKFTIFTDSSVVDNRGYIVSVGNMAPDFEMQLSDGKKVRLSSLRGKIGKIDELKKTTGITYPAALDLDASIFQLYAEKEAGITRNVIIDKEGKIVMLARFYDKGEFARMVQLINTLLT